MKYRLVLFIAIFSVNELVSQIHDNGIGGYGYVDFNIMTSEKMQGNWIYGGGGLIVNKVYFAGLYYGSQIKAFNNFDFNGDFDSSRTLIDLNKPDSLLGVFNLTLSEVGGQIGGVIWAEKPLQVVVSQRAGLLLSNLNEPIPFSGLKTEPTTQAFLTLSPEVKISFMPIRIMKAQFGVGYKHVFYGDSRLKESGPIGNRNSMLNSMYFSLSLVFGSF
jgi:hypothetical protein